MWLYYFLLMYILCFGFIFKLKLSITKRKTVYLFATFGLFFLLSALRSSYVGNDTEEYLRVFRNIASSKDFSGYLWRFEKGYLYLNKILSYITMNQQIILIITSLIIMYGFARFIFKYSKSPVLSTYLFFTFGYYGMTMNTIRQSIAIVILLYSYDFLRNRRLIKFVLMVIIASLFHRTAIFFLLAVFITKLRYNKKTLFLFAITSFALYGLFEYIFKFMINIFPTYTYYVESIYLDGNIRMASIINMFVAICVIIIGIMTKYHKTEMYDRELRGLNNPLDGQNYLMLILTGISITFVSFNFNLLDRVGDYFLIYMIVYLPNSIIRLKNRELRTIIYYLIIILFFVYATTIIIFRPEWSGIYPYSFHWNH
ncbi:EpsG family protein [Globicatella sulfidifaciens]|uniref:EpsG family protein n=1 Tax=Globicatella sulfidifaciens TaxID=136093 RepID=UPI00288FC36D|nr:EpsG family protein [Globicatella sulfidifaciens]MDT2767635.1 EpsG family protein [Globicatella sulfidifaciens]